MNPLVPEQGAGAVLSERPIADNELPICLQPRECKLSAWNMSWVIKAENETKVGGNGNLIRWWPLPRLPAALKGVGWTQGPMWGQRGGNWSYESKNEQEEGRSSSITSDHSKFGRCFWLGRGRFKWQCKGYEEVEVCKGAQCVLRPHLSPLPFLQTFHPVPFASVSHNLSIWPPWVRDLPVSCNAKEALKAIP